MDKKIITIIIIIVLVIIIISAGVGGYFWWNSVKKSGNILENANGSAEKIIEDATKGVLPSLQTNPLENKPDINPADAANPIKNIKTNPFE